MTGCLADTGAAEGGELYTAYACTGVAAITMVHGVVKLTKPDGPRPEKPKPEPPAVYAMPWFRGDAGGAAIAGVF